MTREKTIQLVADKIFCGNSIELATRWTDLFEILGLIKLDKSQPDLLMDKLEHELRKRYFHDNEMIGLKQAITDLGLEIVEKTKR